MRFIWLMLILLASGTAIAHAASFDCTKAKTPQEKAICSSPELSTADEQMAAAYHRWLTAADPQLASEIRNNQRTWHRILSEECKTDLSSAKMQDCLSAVYGERINELAHMVQSIGGVTFVWRTITLTARDSPDDNPIGASEVTPGFGTLQASWPQSAAATSEWTAWNQGLEAAAREFAQSSDGGSDEQTQWKAEPGVDSETSVSINSVGPQLITATIADFWNGHGAHPNHGSVEFNWLLKQKRELQPGDMFIAISGWQSWMQIRLDQYLHHTLDSEADQDYQSFFEKGEMAKVLQSIVNDPKSWTLDDRGLAIVFQPYQVACYACTPPPLTIPWSDLKPYLNPAFSVPR